MTSTLDRLLNSAIDWETTKESLFVFQTVFESKVVLLRLNDFPEEPLCTVICDGIETDMLDFPKHWTLPRQRDKLK